MKRILTICVVSMLLLLSCFTTSTATNENNTIYVDDDGTADYTSIQDAVDAASDGDMIFVYSGTYYENVEIKSKSISIQGEEKETTIIDGNNNKSVIWVEKANSVTISELTLQHSGKDWMESGIVLWDCSDCIITKNIINNCGWGIYLGISTNISATKNEIQNNLVGIQLTNTKHSEIKSNNINYNSRTGIRLGGAQFNTITENNFIDNEKPLSFYGVFFNNINANYWDQKINLKIRPFFGLLFSYMPIPGLIFDWNPANVPFDIQ